MMILFVDDEVELLELAERVLRKASFHVARALSGEEALQQLAERGYDLVVLDVRMPGISGRDVYRTIQERYPHLANHVIFTTGDTANDPTLDWLEGTGCWVLLKPFSIEQLLDAVRFNIASCPSLAQAPACPRLDRG